MKCINSVQAEARYQHVFHGKFYASKGLSSPLTKNPVGRQANEELADYFNKLCNYIDRSIFLTKVTSKND